MFVVTNKKNTNSNKNLGIKPKKLVMIVFHYVSSHQQYNAQDHIEIKRQHHHIKVIKAFISSICYLSSKTKKKMKSLRIFFKRNQSNGTSPHFTDNLNLKLIPPPTSIRMEIRKQIISYFPIDIFAILYHKMKKTTLSFF